MSSTSDNEDTAPDHARVPSWYAEIFPAGPSDGFFHKFGVHAASFVDRGTHQLVISFDNLADAGYPHMDIEAWATKFVRDNGWSHLGIYARGPSWYRDARLISFMEGLRDQGFFARFDAVALVGTSMGGFAALTFSSLIPGARVVALSPQSTLASDLVPWEGRFAKGRAQDWTLPYSDAAVQLSELGQAYVLYDPFFEEDKKHVMRMPQERLIHLRAFGFGHKTAMVLRRMELLKTVMHGGILGTLKPEEFYAKARARKDIYIYRVSMESHLTARGKDNLLKPFRAAFRRRKQAKQVAGTDAAEGD